MAELGLVISHLFDRPEAGLDSLVDQAAVCSLRKSVRPGRVGACARLSFHWGLGPVLADFEKAFVAEGLDRFLAQNEIELFSFDLGPAAPRHQGILPLEPPLDRAAIMNRSQKALKFLRGHYSGPLAAENYNFYPTGLYNHIAEPDFINEYLREFGLGLVLDLAHAAVSAHNLNLELEDYLQSLPLELVREIHISRPWLPSAPGLWAADEHQAPGPREWGWLAKLLTGGRLPGRVPVYIEYYGDSARLIQTQASLAVLLESISNST